MVQEAGGEKFLMRDFNYRETDGMHLGLHGGSKHEVKLKEIQKRKHIIISDIYDN